MSEKENGGAIVTQDEAPLAQSLEMVPLEMIEKRIDYFNRLERILIQRTKSKDWTDFKGKPWLGDAGAERFLGPCGIVVEFARDEHGLPHFVREEFDDERGKCYVFRIFGTASIGGRPPKIDVCGSSSTRKRFFAEYKDAKGNKAYRALAEIDLNHVQNDALSDIYRDAVVRLLGLRGLTWEDLERMGIRRGEGGTVTFDGSTPGQEKKTAPRQSSSSSRGSSKGSGKASDPDDAQRIAEQRIAYQQKLDSVFGTDTDGKKTAEGWLESVTSFEGDHGFVKGKRKLDDLTDKHVMSKFLREKFQKIGKEEGGAKQTEAFPT